MENNQSEQGKQPAQYRMVSRGSKTKGNSYKHRYVEKICPECSHNKAYEDVMKTRVQYSCMKRNCRHKWVEPIGNRVARPVPKKPGHEESN